MEDTQIRRRRLLRLGLAPLAALTLPSLGQAADIYPSRPVRIVIGFPPGTSTDLWARLIAQRLQFVLKQAVFVDNKAGAHGQIGCITVKNAAKDGYTLLYASMGTAAINMALYGQRLQYDTLRDFDPIVPVERSTIYLAASKKLPVNNLKDMLEYVRARPGQISYGSGGSGTTSHLAMEMLKKATGLQMTHVPYRGSAAVVQDLIGGQIHFAFDTAPAFLPQMKAGHLQIIGVAAPQRISSFPDIPTIAEQGVPNFEARLWSGLFAPVGTPQPILARLNAVINDELKNGAFADTMNVMGAEPFGGSSQDFRVLIAKEIPRWTVAVRESGATPD